jgi:hypothetical protein
MLQREVDAAERGDALEERGDALAERGLSEALAVRRLE